MWKRFLVQPNGQQPTPGAGSEERRGTPRALPQAGEGDPGRVCEASVRARGQRQWSTAGEAVLGKMPPLQVVLTELPTEQHLAPPVQRGKVDQPTIGVSKDDPLLLELLERLLDVERHCRLPGSLGRGAGRGRGRLGRRGGSVGAAGRGALGGSRRARRTRKRGVPVALRRHGQMRGPPDHTQQESKPGQVLPGFVHRPVPHRLTRLPTKMMSRSRRSRDRGIPKDAPGSGRARAAPPPQDGMRPRRQPTHDPRRR